MQRKCREKAEKRQRKSKRTEEEIKHETGINQE
jgi:hypothetical protein